MKGLLGILVVLLAVGVLFFAYFDPPEDMKSAEMTDAEIAQVEAEVREQLTNRLEVYQDAIMRGDVETITSFFTSDAWFLGQGTNLSGEELQAFMVEVFPTMTVTEMNGEMLDLFVHGEVAYAIYEFSETIEMEGQEPDSMILNCFTRWEKEDGLWKFDRDVCGPRDAPEEG